MFDLDPEKILMLGLVALVVLGPNRLPEAARGLGRAMSHWRKVSASLQSEMRDALGEPGADIVNTINDLRGANVSRTIRNKVTSAVTASTLEPNAVPHQPAQPTPRMGAASPTPDDPNLN